MFQAMLASTDGGKGDFVSTVIDLDLYPTSQEYLATIYPEEEATAPHILELHRGVFISSTKISRLGKALRQGEQQTRTDAMLTQCASLRRELRQFWRSHCPSTLQGDASGASRVLPSRIQSLYENAYLMYRSSLVFSYVSMWVRQRLAAGAHDREEVEKLASEIVDLCRLIVQQRRFEKRFAVFPLFIAGYSSTDQGKKMEALEYLHAMEAGMLGRNTKTLAYLLEVVYERQRAARTMEAMLAICWKEVMKELGLYMVTPVY